MTLSLKRCTCILTCNSPPQVIPNLFEYCDLWTSPFSSLLKAFGKTPRRNVCAHLQGVREDYWGITASMKSFSQQMLQNDSQKPLTKPQTSNILLHDLMKQFGSLDILAIKPINS